MSDDTRLIRLCHQFFELDERQIVSSQCDVPMHEVRVIDVGSLWWDWLRQIVRTPATTNHGYVLKLNVAEAAVRRMADGERPTKEVLAQWALEDLCRVRL